MAETIGSRLKAARESKGMSIEDVAFETRIRGSYLKCLEADDYSQFASTTYAKSFLTLYSRFLEVEVDEAMHYFKGRDEIHLSGKSSYLAAVQPIESVTAPKVTRTTETDEDGATVVVERERPGVAPIFLGVIVVLLISAIPILWWIGREANSIDEATEKAKELVENANQAVTAVGNATEGGKTPAAGSETERPKLALESREVAASWLIEDAEPAPPSTPTPPRPQAGNETSADPVVATPATPVPGTPGNSTLDQSAPPSPSPSEQSIATTVTSPTERPRFGVPAGSAPLPPAFPADLPPEPLPADAPPGALALQAGALLPLPGNRTAEETPAPSPPSIPDTPPPAPLVAQGTGSPAGPASAANPGRKPRPKPEEDPEPEPEPAQANPEPEPDPEPTPAPASRGPLRAVPLVAQPVVLPEVDVPSGEEDEDGNEAGDDEASDSASEEG